MNFSRRQSVARRSVILGSVLYGVQLELRENESTTSSCRLCMVTPYRYNCSAFSRFLL